MLLLCTDCWRMLLFGAMEDGMGSTRIKLSYFMVISTLLLGLTRIKLSNFYFISIINDFWEFTWNVEDTLFFENGCVRTF